jgi:hypothetical protein
MPIRNWLRDEFSLGSLASQVMWTIISAALGRASAWLFDVPVRSEIAYWLVVPALVFALAIAVRKLSGRKTRPDLNCLIEHMSFGGGDFKVDGRDASGAIIMILASIRNRGVPTVASSYRLIFELPNGQLFHGKRLNPAQETIGLENVDTGRKELLHRNDALDKRTVEPIPQGGMAQGFLVFAFPGIDPKLIQNAGATVRFRFIDAWMREYVIVHQVGELNKIGATPHLPGVTVTSVSIEKEIPRLPEAQSADE